MYYFHLLFANANCYSVQYCLTKLLFFFFMILKRTRAGGELKQKRDRNIYTLYSYD